MHEEKEMLWMKYAIFDDEGDIVALSKEAPEEVKKTYEKHLNKIKEYTEKGKAIPK